MILLCSSLDEPCCSLISLVVAALNQSLTMLCIACPLSIDGVEVGATLWVGCSFLNRGAMALPKTVWQRSEKYDELVCALGP
jgi:hypothetical protein